MHGLYVERRTVSKITVLSQDLAHHLFTRLQRGKVVIVTPRPSGFMGAVKKQWSHVVRQAQNERSRTLDADRIQELSNEIERMQQLSFSAKPPVDDLQADLTFATLDNLLKVPPVCYTLYVTCQVARDQLHLVSSWMPQHSLVVLYDLATEESILRNEDL